MGVLFKQITLLDDLESDEAQAAARDFNGSFLAISQCGGSERKTPLVTECKPRFAWVAGLQWFAPWRPRVLFPIIVAEPAHCLTVGALLD